MGGRFQSDTGCMYSICKNCPFFFFDWVHPRRCHNFPLLHMAQVWPMVRWVATLFDRSGASFGPLEPPLDPLTYSRALTMVVTRSGVMVDRRPARSDKAVSTGTFRVPHRLVPASGYGSPMENHESQVSPVHRFISDVEVYISCVYVTRCRFIFCPFFSGGDDMGPY